MTEAPDDDTLRAGVVRWFNDARGYGFIAMPGLDHDVLVHQSEIVMNGFRRLRPGEQVQFILRAHDKGYTARQVQPVSLQPGVGAAQPSVGRKPSIDK